MLWIRASEGFAPTLDTGIRAGHGTTVVPTAGALRWLRTRAGLTQSAAGKLDGSPDHRTLSHWETRRKVPSLPRLHGYLAALGLDFHALQDALDQSAGKTVADPSMRARLAALETRLAELDQLDHQARLVDVEGRLSELERGSPSAWLGSR